VRAGDRVAWLFDNRHGLDALVLYHAVLALGAVNVPVNTRLTAREVEQIVTHCDARLVIATALGEETVASIGDDRTIVRTPAEDARSVLRGVGEMAARPGDTDLANILYTSGTTGVPKGVGSRTVRRSQRPSDGAARSSHARRRVAEPFPIFSAQGCTSTPSRASSPVPPSSSITTRRPPAWHSSARRTTVYVAVPSICAFWLDHWRHPTPARIAARLRLRRASMPPSMIERLRAAVPTAGLIQSYGLTEAGPGGTYLPEEYALTKLGSIGNRCAGRFTSVRVLGDDGRDVGPDTVGELLLRGPSVMEGYHRDPDASAATFHEGWLRTGDLVRVDGDGFFFHVDRKKDIIVRGGFNIGSVEVESALVSHPAVAEAAVIGVPHERLGEDVYALVVLRPGCSVDDEELLAHCQPLLADFKRPRHIEVVPDLPRNSAGKVLKARLRAAVRGDIG
jgi:acyl-CoA synthetase (AMP-forming)/AMP-acid ligase II